MKIVKELTVLYFLLFASSDRQPVPVFFLVFAKLSTVSLVLDQLLARLFFCALLP